MATINKAQHPISSGFGAATKADEVTKGIDLSGKTVIVTGGYSGLGLETVRVLHNAGAKVIVPTRDKERAAANLKEIDGVEIENMDLLNPASIDAFAARFVATGQPLHILINSAGIMANPLNRDARGYESQFATNHLGHFQLTAGLWPALLQANGARVVSVSSWGHRFSPIVFDDPNFEHRPYDRWAAYGQSKTANILFALQLDELGKAHYVRAFSVHPGGIVGTGLDKHLSKEELQKAGALDENGKPIFDPARSLKTVAEGAATQVWCAASPQLDGLGGVYAENCDIAAVIPETAVENTTLLSATRAENNGVMPYAVDGNNAAQLWLLSEQLTGVVFK